MQGIQCQMQPPVPKSPVQQSHRQYQQHCRSHGIYWGRMQCQWQQSHWRQTHQAQQSLQQRPLQSAYSSSLLSSNLGRCSSSRSCSSRLQGRSCPTNGGISSRSSQQQFRPQPLVPQPDRSTSSNARGLRSPPLSAEAPAAAAGGAAAAAAEAAAAEIAHAARLAAPVVVIGGGPAGLATAIMLARRGYTNIKVFERLPEPPAPDDMSVWANFEQASERLYMIGLNGRGQAVLRDLGVMDRIDQASSLVLGRMDWQPDIPPDSPKLSYYGSTRTYKTRCIQRDRLASCLLQELREKYSSVVSVTFGACCVHADWTKAIPEDDIPEVCRLTFQLEQPSSSTGNSTSTISAAASKAESSSTRSSEVKSSSSGVSSTSEVSSSSSSTHSSTSSSTSAPQPTAKAATASKTKVPEIFEVSSFVIGADGAGSSLRTAMERSSRSRSRPLKLTRIEDKNTIVYRTIPLFWPKDLADSRPGDVNYSARTKSGISLDCLPTREGPYIGVMLYKPGDKRIAALKTAEDVRALFKDIFPAFLPAVREVDLERFAAKGDSSLPTFSYAGPVLHYGSSACLLGDTIHTVKPYFGQGVNSAFEDVKVLQQALDETADDHEAAVRRYSQLRAKDAEALVVLSHSLDGGFVTFVGPLILDSMLHRLLPQIFSPNIIASLQNEKWSFSQIQKRKQVDRALQVALLAAVAVVFVRATTVLLGLAYKLLSRFGAV